MKKYITLSLGLFFAMFHLCAQDISRRDVPSVVRNNFQNAFPEATDVEWERSGSDYEVEFEIGFWNDDHTVRYDREGKLLRHRKEIAKKELPDAVYAVIKKNYMWYLITDAEQITEGNRITYQVELKSFMREKEILFDASGAVLEEEED